MLPRISNNCVTIARTTVASSGTLNSEYVSASGAQEFLAKINTGAVGTSVDAQLVQAQDLAGTGSKALTTPKAITQITSADQYAEIELQQDEMFDLLDLDNGVTFIGLEIVIAGTSFASGELITTYQTDEDNVPSATVADEIVRRTIS